MGIDTQFSKEQITKIVIETIEQMFEKTMYVPTGISVRHIHLEQSHLEKLFGKDYKLTPKKDLSQKGQFASEETVDLIGPKGIIKNVRILGPTRKRTQVEIALSDSRVLGIRPPVRKSGDLENSASIILRGPNTEIKISEGVIIADRHIHMSNDDAKKFNVVNNEIVQVRIDGEKSGIFDNVTIRVDESYVLDFHIDTDDANAFLMEQGQLVKIIKK